MEQSFVRLSTKYSPANWPGKHNPFLEESFLGEPLFGIPWKSGDMMRVSSCRVELRPEPFLTSPLPIMGRGLGGCQGRSPQIRKPEKQVTPKGDSANDAVVGSMFNVEQGSNRSFKLVGSFLGDPQTSFGH